MNVWRVQRARRGEVDNKAGNGVATIEWLYSVISYEKVIPEGRPREQSVAEPSVSPPMGRGLVVPVPEPGAALRGLSEVVAVANPSEIAPALCVRSSMRGNSVSAIMPRPPRNGTI